MNSSQPVPSLLCVGSLVSSPNTLPSVCGGSTVESSAGGELASQRLFPWGRRKRKWTTLQGLLLQMFRACHCSERKELVWHHLLMKSGVGLESRVPAGALEFEKRRSRTLLVPGLFFLFYSDTPHAQSIHTYTDAGFDNKICEFLKWHS